MENKKPLLKLEVNIPVTVTFDTATDDAKEFENKFDPEKPQHLYHVRVLTDGSEEEQAWFASDRQHHELMQRGVQLGKKYEIVNRKKGGDKYPTFIVKELSGDGTTMPQKEISEEEVLEVMTNSEEKTPINANKESKKRDPQSVAWAIKTAVQWKVHSNEPDEEKRLKESARKLLRIHDELMSE